MKRNIFYCLLLATIIFVSDIAVAGEPSLFNAMSKPISLKKSGGQKNVAKMSLLRLVNPYHRDFDFGFERVLTDHISASLSMAVKIPYMSAMARAYDNYQETITDESGYAIATSTMHISPLKGFGIVPEVRFYTSKSNDAPHGFYLAPYFKYYSTKMSASADVEFYDPTIPDASSTVEFKLTEAGGGLQLGYQWIVGPGITIDWYFLGPRISKFNFTLLFEGSLGDPTYYAESAGEMEDTMKEIPIVGDNATVTTTSNSLEVKAPFWFPNVRSGVALGFAF